jgi:F-type H+-transporting ATPase subunit delta
MADRDSSGGEVTGVAGRYASALFDLALEARKLEEVGEALAGFGRMIEASGDLRRLVRSPVFSADDQIAALGAILAKAGVSGIAANFLKLAAKNRRLFAVEDMIKAFAALAAWHRGEVPAEVTSAVALKPTQVKELKAALAAISGKDVVLAEKVDASLIGGLIVRLGSRMIDSSIRTKLNALKLSMKEVG